MNTVLPNRQGRSIFRDDEPVIQGRPLLGQAETPTFGTTVCWDLNGVVENSASMARTAMRIWFPTGSDEWNLLGREMAMIWLNPRYPAVLERGLHLPDRPLNPVGVSQRVAFLRAIAEYGQDNGLPDDPARWRENDFHDFVARRSQTHQASSLCGPVLAIKTLHRFARALACGGLVRDPWPGKSTNKVANQPIVPPLTTPVIKPETWFPLVRAAWTYIDVFAPDILRAQHLWTEAQARGRVVSISEGDQMLRSWIADPASKVPISTMGAKRGINWSLLTRLVGIHSSVDLFEPDHRTGRARRALIREMAADGGIQSGLLAEPIEVDRPDGSRGPWHPSLHPYQLAQEATMLRNACYNFVAALSMMRNSEIREIVKGSVVQHYGSPAVTSTKRKLDPDLPTKHWWIIDPVAKAIDIASQLSADPTLAFSSTRRDQGFVSQHAVSHFIRHVNAMRAFTGLAEIPAQKVTPHMYRRTMALLTRDYPGSEVAVGMQLKHVASRALANRTTQSYMDNDPSWARQLDHAIAERRFERLKELFDADSRGETIGYGPGADRMCESFAAVRHQAEALRASGQARAGDARVELDLLRRTRISLRFGTLNHCTMNDDDPTGAKCLEDAVVPEGHRGPLIDRCRPGRCANSVLSPEHLPLWQVEKASLTRLLATPGLPPPRRAAPRSRPKPTRSTSCSTRHSRDDSTL